MKFLILCDVNLVFFMLEINLYLIMTFQLLEDDSKKCKVNG